MEVLEASGVEIVDWNLLMTGCIMKVTAEFVGEWGVKAGAGVVSVYEIDAHAICASSWHR